MKKLTDEEVDTIEWALLNLSQDIRFAAQFPLKTHEALEHHLTKTHEEIIKISKIISGDLLSDTISMAREMTEVIFGKKDDK